jgi:DNA-binding transcriptional regulator YdaS (Cro superfamily)
LTPFRRQEDIDVLQMTPEEWLREAIRRVGGYSALARELGLTKQAIAQWTVAPPRHATAIERLTGIRRETLRPDVFEPDFVIRDDVGNIIIGEVKSIESFTDEGYRRHTDTTRSPPPRLETRGYLVSEEICDLVVELFDDELEQAKELLTSGCKNAAAVVAGLVLETALHKLCEYRGIPVGKLDKVSADLANAGVYDKQTHERITALDKIRNTAAHGLTPGFHDTDVKAMIVGIQEFVSSHLGRRRVSSRVE